MTMTTRTLTSSERHAASLRIDAAANGWTIPRTADDALTDVLVHAARAAVYVSGKTAPWFVAADGSTYPTFGAPLSHVRVPVRVVCSWCDATATHNLHTTRDQCCAAHYAQWFAPDADTISAAGLDTRTAPTGVVSWDAVRMGGAL